jgi:glycosyltransferase involved in cell wall biosynthesis
MQSKSHSSASKRPKIAYVVNSLNPGGAERLVVQMSRSFTADFEVSVVCIDEPGLWGLKLREKGIPVYCLWRQAGLDLSMALKLAQYCRRHRIDIIHAHQCTPWFYAALSRMICGAPKLLLEEHGRLFPEIESPKRILANRLVIKPLTHRFVAVSEDIRRRMVRYEGLDYERIDVVYNGVAAEPPPDSTSRNKICNELGIGRGDFLVGTVGRIDPIKNLPLLLKAIAGVREQARSIRGLLVGDGPVFEDIKALRDQLGLSHTVVMPGHRDDARRLIACMDLFVLPSFSEGTSMALLEAMAAGAPVAVTDVGGNPEIVTNGETGWVVPSDSIKELSRVILNAASDSRTAAQFGEAGRRRFEERFSYQKMIDSYRSIYSEMIGPDKSGAIDSPFEGG